MTDGTILMSAEEIDRALSRIAHQVLEFTGGTRELALCGIHTRGVPLARRLAWKIAQAGEVAPPVGILDINLYRDDLTTGGDRPVVRTTDVPFRIAEREVVLVDDVLFTGRTIRAAMDALTDLGRPRAIRLAVLIDRGGRELPIQPDFAGRTFTIQPTETIDLRLAEIDGGPDQVLLRKSSEIAAARAAARERLAALTPKAAPGAKPATGKPVKGGGASARPASRKSKGAGRKGPKKAAGPEKAGRPKKAEAARPEKAGSRKPGSHKKKGKR